MTQMATSGLPASPENELNIRMKHLITLVATAFVSTGALASTPIEKIDQRFPQNIGEFQLIRRSVVPAETNRVTYAYKVPNRSNVTLTITALNPTRDSVDIDGMFRKAMEDYAKSEPARTVSELPAFPDILIGQGCGPKFQQLSFKSQGRVYSYVNNNFATVFDRHLVRISVVHEDKTSDQQLELLFLNYIRSALGDCK